MNEFEKLVLEKLETIGQRMDHVETGIQEVQKDVKGLHEEIHEVREDVKGLHEEMHEVREDVKGLHGEMHEVREDVKGLHGEMHEMREDVKGLHGEMYEMRENMEHLHGEMYEVQEDVKKVRNDTEVLKIRQDLTHKKLDDLLINIKVSERAIRSDIRKLQDGQETIHMILEGNGLLPQMSESK